MKNDMFYDKMNGVDQSGFVLKTLQNIEQRLESEFGAKQEFIEWQQVEHRRLQSELGQKNRAISDLNDKLVECRSNVEGNRQLINKLITDIDRLQQNIEWYKRTYETRSLFGVIKDKLKHIFR
jgi:predicted  nucleic acid-binding Zn-ribbon protein